MFILLNFSLTNFILDNQLFSYYMHMHVPYMKLQVWNINSSTDDPTQSFVEPENVDLFFTDCHRHFMIYCDSDDTGSNADVRRLSHL